jgi:integrase
MRHREGEFGIYPRCSRKTVYFYYWVYDNDGKRKYRSTGKLSYNEALKYCRSLQVRGQLFQSTSYSFDIFTKDFFDYEKCPYIKSRLLRGYSYGKTWAKRQRSLLQHIIQPYFNDTDIRTISSKTIDDFTLQLRQNNTGAKTLNHILTTLKAVFGYAERTGIIDINPVKGIKPFKATAREKGVFTREELSTLFSNPEKSKIWNNPMHFLLNCLAATTGLRMGELLALMPEDISGTTIKITHSWNRLDGLKGTKTGKTRVVPISLELGLALERYINTNNISSFIFSTNGGKKPIDHKAVYKYFWNALTNSGIDKKSREIRNISFHSYRHTFNTLLLESGIHPETIRLITGHSANMTARYSHIQLNNMPEILNKVSFLNKPVLSVAAL